MPSTARLALPYPSLTDAPNGPANIQSLATALEGLRCHARVGFDTADYAFVADGANYTVPFVSTNGFLSGISLSTSTRLLVPKTGVYRMSAQARLTRTVASASSHSMAIRKNSADAAGSGTLMAGAWGTGTVDNTLHTSILLSLTAADYLQMFVTSLNGSTLKSGGAYMTFLCLEFLHF